MASYLIAASYGNNPVSHYFFGLSDELGRRGHSVCVLVDGQRADAVRSGNPRILTWPSRRPTTMRDALFLHRLLLETKPATIIANFGSVTLSMIVGALNSIPVRISWYHTLSSQIRADHPTPWIKQWLLERRKGLVYDRATHVVAVSRAALDDARTTYRIPLKKSFSLPLLLHDPGIISTTPDPSRIVCVGRLYPSKGQDSIIRAIPAIRRVVSGAHVEFLGEGPSRNEYEDLARVLGVLDHCTFSGWIPLDQVYQRLGGAAVAVVASHSEAFGLAAVEAQALGVPLVASNVGGMRETVIDGETGYLIPPGDPEALADRILRILGDPAKRARLGKQGREHFVRHYSLGHIGEHADRIESLAP